MGKQVTVKGFIQEAKYVREEKSIVMVLMDPETKRCTKPMQISSSQFSFRPDQDVDDEMLKTAHLLEEFPHPISLVFDEDAADKEAAREGPVIPANFSLT